MVASKERNAYSLKDSLVFGNEEKCSSHFYVFFFFSLSLYIFRYGQNIRFYFGSLSFSRHQLLPFQYAWKEIKLLFSLKKKLRLSAVSVMAWAINQSSPWYVATKIIDLYLKAKMTTLNVEMQFHNIINVENVEGSCLKMCIACSQPHRNLLHFRYFFFVIFLFK